MSTFDGIISEFPDIRVDFFRYHAGRRPPLAGFLSHIHSDHLHGLESFKSPFIYCSPATKQMLPCLERYPCRINFANGILEARKQTYKHLKSLLKPLPLNTPTVLELEPGSFLTVTLFDANHCPGAVMFLFEKPGTAVLYTGDMRSEPWLVNSLTRSPALIEYASGMKTLDKIYLDTSCLDTVDFQAKAEGLQELLHKVVRYPKETVFFLQAWTYGYEDVWIALSKALNSKIHVDEYKMGIYKSLVLKDSKDKYAAQFYASPEAASLVGFMCGNAQQDGCLTLDLNVRLHSCEKGTYCATVAHSPVVWIKPIVAHLPDGRDLVEIGIGGGGDDLEREAELDMVSADEAEMFLEAVRQDEEISDDAKEGIHAFLADVIARRRNVTLEDLDISTFGEKQEMSISKAIRTVAQKSTTNREEPGADIRASNKAHLLPTRIVFPYARHSSLPEQCLLVDAFKPRDVWPCTVSQREWLRDGISIAKLFGQHCSGSVFEHDVRLEAFSDHLLSLRQIDSQRTEFSVRHSPKDESIDHYTDHPTNQLAQLDPSSQRASEMDDALDVSQLSNLSQEPIDMRAIAFETMLRNTSGGGDWHPIGLISTTDHHSHVEEELGE